ncbi:MAG: ketopantoate reductase family protein [Chloroflexi bacterium]|nr:ketopantoate reductase family protein [Chloroflexota bacterium]MCL5109082.1 ketopantoate reductase family protein [Chloroflexota bacterium]
MRIAVVGAGAMGCLFGGKLARAAEVWLYDPWREHVEAIRRDGLRIVEPTGENTVFLPATTDPAEIGQVDLGIIFVKSHQTEWAASIARGLLKPNGLALTLQNGLGNGEVIARVLGPERAWQGVTSHGATLLGPGRVRHAGTGPTHLELREDIAEQAEEVARTFQQAELETHLSSDLDSLIWGKLVINVGINALTAILRVPNGTLAEVPAGKALMDAAIAEAVAVCTAKGIKLPYEDAAKRCAEVAIATGANRSSMLQDVLRANRTEVDVINGAVVREAAKLGLRVPVNEVLTGLLKAVEATYSIRIQ